MRTIEPEQRESTTWRDGVAALTMMVAAMAIVAAVIGIGLAMRAVAQSQDAEDAAAAGGTSQTVMVSLSEFKVPDVDLAPDGKLHVMNAGSVAHNLSVQGTKLHTDDIQPGRSELLDLQGLAPGTYTLFCNLPGHKDAGMSSTLTIGGAGSGGATAGAAGGVDHAAMTQAMVDTMTSFPAATAGVGNTTLEPTEVRADGTKVFDLVAEVAKWERSPGDVVDAWTYNGEVPAPSIHINVGDKVEFRLRNELEIATDLHLHGLNVDNAYDGVAPLTQPLVQPGETFTYEYTADEVAVAMYHPHFMSQLGMPNGMFGTIFVGEVPLPAGRTIGGEAIPADVAIAQEFPMVLNDGGVIGYSLNGKSFPATAPIVAHQGDWMLVHYFNEGTQVHPMHLHQFDQVVIAKDGFPLDEPYLADTVTVAPGERYSVLVHLDKVGTWAWHCHILPHVEGDDGMFGMVTAVIVQ